MYCMFVQDLANKMSVTAGFQSKRCVIVCSFLFPLRVMHKLRLHAEFMQLISPHCRIASIHHQEPIVYSSPMLALSTYAYVMHDGCGYAWFWQRPYNIFSSLENTENGSVQLLFLSPSLSPSPAGKRIATYLYYSRQLYTGQYN